MASRVARRYKEQSGYYGQKKHRILHFLVWTLLLITMVTGAGVWWLKGYIDTAPALKVSRLVDANNQATIQASDGTVIWRSTRHQRLIAKYSEIPTVLKDALLSVEDRNFYKETGVNYTRTMSAVAHDVINGNKAQGGSTLTQQLIKLGFFSTAASDKTVKRKVQEMYLAEQLNQQYSKNEILTFYINKVYMGLGVYGMKTAAKYYFGKELKDISLTQAALLAGLVQSPSAYEPYNHPTAALNRRNTVLQTMYENKKISKKAFNRYLKVPLTDDVVPLTSQEASKDTYAKTQLETDSFVQSALLQLKAKKVNLHTQAVTVKTTLDLNIQRQLLQIVNQDSGVPWPDNELQTAVTVINNQTGAVVAQVGGRQQTSVGSFNRADSNSRSSGSTIKPLADYAPALDLLKWNTTTILDDSPYQYPNSNTQVYDWDDKYQGKITLRSALVGSRNIPAIKTLAAVGLDSASSLLSLAGFNDPLYYSSAIGINTSTSRLASAYTALADGGVRKSAAYLNSITDSVGKTDTLAPVKTDVMTAQSAYMLTDMLKGVPQTGQSGAYAKIDGLTQAGKTGTTGFAADQQMPDGAVSDEWYAGYIKQYTIVVWTGYDNPTRKDRYITEANANVPQTIYKKMIQYLTANGADSSDWVMPSQLKKVMKNGKAEYSWIADPTVTVPSIAAQSDKAKAAAIESQNAEVAAAATASSEQAKAETKAKAKAKAESKKRASEDTGLITGGDGG